MLKNKLKFIAVFMIVIVLFFVSGLSFFIKDIAMNNSKNKIIVKYKSEKTRLEYFNKYNEEFDYLAKYLSNHINIAQIFKGDNCYSNQYILSKKNDIVVCSVSEENYDDIDILMDVFNKLNLESYKNNNETLVFILYSTMSGGVAFEYCIDSCDFRDNTYKEKDRTRITNKINEKWQSEYNDIHSI